jgi:hypothetical protein
MSGALQYLSKGQCSIVCSIVWDEEFCAAVGCSFSAVDCSRFISFHRSRYASLTNWTLTSNSVRFLMVFIEGTNCGPKSNKFAVPLGRSDVDVNTVTLGHDSKLLSVDGCEVCGFFLVRNACNKTECSNPASCTTFGCSKPTI